MKGGRGEVNLSNFVALYIMDMDMIWILNLSGEDREGTNLMW